MHFKLPRWSGSSSSCCPSSSSSSSSNPGYQLDGRPIRRPAVAQVFCPSQVQSCGGVCWKTPAARLAGSDRLAPVTEEPFPDGRRRETNPPTPPPWWCSLSVVLSFTGFTPIREISIQRRTQYLHLDIINGHFQTFPEWVRNRFFWVNTV